MYKPPDNKKTWGQIVQTLPARTRRNTTTSGIGLKKLRKPKQEALLVRMEGKSYGDILRTMRQTVDPANIGVNVRDIKKTRNGELLLTVEEGSKKVEELKREIEEKNPQMTTSVLISKKVLHIRDLDEVTTEDEIRKAICEVTSAKPESFEIKALRPANRNKQNVTVIISEGDAYQLLTAGKIKIGWPNCRVIEREREKKCYRCWGHGHVKAQCKGPDRERNCMKCGKEGHKAAEC
ncbi:unnamed protein product [Psylliodes chrysocephalus]|uniref:CCHC-type domain-containing protein n=1 Tax=Psylliodes chrysocephalus TaxID=3402493 RepID=A0A9P0CWY3_9CUCU|nr:unnamed protein product [Psylliodes chrysocephala]